ncbi:uncharacterized protein ATNIH1004_002635 [Aspergillus tanneri]|uniref:Uncharacterized protein n=1 Tax=Aspergillus tanneri TaxID=1220188 RepID=A0A5M9MVK9_9EURO|nr:uncharacterized protein ATNIH1004_002635 [Aspergillus tanneri]KAA8649956.1 hypothetical protein ATNIH1004_002635 [Aspergillus tanneri]
MSRGFEFYCAVGNTAKQNIEFVKKPIELLVLALGGSLFAGANMTRLAQNLASF